MAPPALAESAACEAISVTDAVATVPVVTAASDELVTPETGAPETAWWEIGCVAETTGCVAETTGCVAETTGCAAETTGCVAETTGCVAEETASEAATTGRAAEQTAR